MEREHIDEKPGRDNRRVDGAGCAGVIESGTSVRSCSSSYSYSSSQWAIE